jgi:hypothetical protein
MAQLVAQVVNLGMAVVAWGNGVGGFGGQNLVGLELAVGPAFIRVSGLQEPAAAAAAEVVGTIGVHVDKVFLTDHRLDHEAKVLGHRVAEGLANQLAGVLNGELDLAILVPIGTRFQFALADPLGVVLNDAFDFEVVVELEFIQSEPDCK